MVPDFDPHGLAVEPHYHTAKDGPWSDALFEFARFPERHMADVVFYDSRVVAIRDRFPKAKIHLLIIPRERIDNLSALLPAHLSLLEHMQTVAASLIEQQLHTNPSLSFRTGFHALPSMRQVHMHVISQDFVAAALKTKRHWNSFTSPFFLGSKTVYKMLRETGRITVSKVDNEEFLKRDLRCHHASCKLPFRNMPLLKTHLESHL